MNDKLIDEIKYIAKGVLIFNLIVLAIFLIISALDVKMFLGLMFGTIIAILNIILLAKSIEKSVTMPVNRSLNIYYKYIFIKDAYSSYSINSFCKSITLKFNRSSYRTYKS